MVRKHISPLDAGSRLRRYPQTQAQRQVILIVCEGQTEEAYFNAVKAFYRRSNTANIKIVRDRSDPVKIVEKGIRDSKNDDFDHVYCVIDGDKPERTTQARKRIQKRKDIDLVVSTPCFELWLLLHFEPCDAPFAECVEVCARLKVRLPDYVKGIQHDFSPITPRIDAAIENAKWLAGRNLTNPATDVHTVLNQIRPAP